MDPCHQHLFIVRAVEDADAATFRQPERRPPQIIVAQLHGAGCLEGGDLAALRVEPRHDMLDGAVLAGCVHGLQHDEHGPARLGIETFLQAV